MPRLLSGVSTDETLIDLMFQCGATSVLTPPSPAVVGHILWGEARIDIPTSRVQLNQRPTGPKVTEASLYHLRPS